MYSYKETKAHELIRLTHFETNKKVWIKISEVKILFEKDDGTEIVVGDFDSPIYVKETPQEIFEIASKE